MNEIYKLLQKLTGYAGEPHYGPERSGDIKHSLADITAAENAIGFDPKVGFEDGLRLTVDWYRTELQLAK